MIKLTVVFKTQSYALQDALQSVQKTEKNNINKSHSASLNS